MGSAPARRRRRPRTDEWPQVHLPDAPDLEIRLRVGSQGGKPVCTGVHLESRHPLTAAAITGQAWTRIMATAIAMTFPVSTPTGTESLLPIRQPLELRWRGRNGYPSGHYDWVVFIFKVALHNAPGKHVDWITKNVEYMKKDSYVPPTAATVHRWLDGARARGAFKRWDDFAAFVEEHAVDVSE